MNKFSSIKLLILLLIFFLEGQNIHAQGDSKLVIRFKSVANSRPLVFQDSNYTNAFNENYQVTRLKYYISNLNLSGPDMGFQSKNVYLIDALHSDSIILDVPNAVFYNLSFTVGVDSILNSSGAQEGALDPLNGMFWTWNTGYIFFKLEGFSSSSTADLHRIEQHIGGYRSPYNASRKVSLTFPATMEINSRETRRIEATLNLDRFFNGTHKISMADQPMIMTPGPAAMKAADNLAQSFSIEAIK